MKLRNKRTGEIIEAVIVDHGAEWEMRNVCTDEAIQTYDSLAELSAEWEDYEEPKKHYEILSMGAVMEREDAEDEIFRNQGQREIGNYFETQEEAEKAVEKLEAWRRLKDGGITFKNWTINQTGTIDCFATWGDNIPPSRKTQLC